jgi:hypothetical protein
MGPTGLFEGAEGGCKFELEDRLGLEIATAVQPDLFQLAVDRLHGVGRRQRAADAVGILEEDQIVVAFLPDFGNEGRGDFGETVAQFIELFVGDLDVPKCLDGPDLVLELGRVVLGKMGFGVSLHVDNAELDVGGGEEPLVQ